MWSSPRSRARFNRACVRRALPSLSTTAMMFLKRGGANLAGRPLLSMAWSCALHCGFGEPHFSVKPSTATSVGACGSSANPWPFDQKFLWSDVSLRLLADPRAIPYLGPNIPLGATTSACPLVADRVSMHRKVAVVLLMTASLLVRVSAWNNPDCEVSGKWC